MNRKITTIYSLALIAGIFFSCCREKSMDGMIIFTRISAKAPSSPTAFNTTPDGSTIIAVDSKGSQMEVLTKDFFSAASPRISFDGKCLLFTAKKNSETPWQIFEMNLENRKVRPVTSCSENCLHPAYLPGERIVFCRINKNDSLRSQSSLFSCNIDGSDSETNFF